MPTKVVLITGAAIRIGACIARTFHAKGFDVAISYRSSLTAAQSASIQRAVGTPR